MPVISGLATILVAAAIDPDRNWVRLRSLPSVERQKLVER